MLIKTKLNVPLSKQIRLWFHQCQLSLFRPFLYSKLDHTTFPDLLLVIEARRYQRTSFSLLRDRSLLAIHRNVGLFAKQFEECQEDFRTHDFKLHDLKLAFCILESSRIIACHLHLNCTQLNCHSVGTLTKALDIEHKATFGQNKLALPKTKIFLLSSVKIFCSAGTVAILTADFMRTN